MAEDQEREEFLPLTRKVFESWSEIGHELHLASHSQIAAFLIRSYRSKLTCVVQNGNCLHCGSPLSWSCPACNSPNPYTQTMEACQSQEFELESSTMEDQLCQKFKEKVVDQSGINLEVMEDQLCQKFKETNEDQSGIKLEVMKDQLCQNLKEKTVDQSGIKLEILCESEFDSQTETRKEEDSVGSFVFVVKNHSEPVQSHKSLLKKTTTVVSQRKNFNGGFVGDNHPKSVTSQKLFLHKTANNREQNLTEKNHSKFVKTHKPLLEKLTRRQGQSSKGDHENLSEHKCHVCEICGENFSKRYRLLVHKKTHVVDHPSEYCCDVCGTVFRTKPRFEKHKKICEKKATKSFYVCHLCGKSMTSCSGLRYHMQLHSGQKNFLCEFCNRRFILAAQLREHQLTHSSERSFACDSCTKTFSTNGSLKKHKLFHGDQKYVCSTCGKKFFQVSHMKRHALTHNRQKPYVCDVCNKAFTQSAHVKAHKNSVHSKEKTIVPSSSSSNTHMDSPVSTNMAAIVRWKEKKPVLSSSSKTQIESAVSTNMAAMYSNTQKDSPVSSKKVAVRHRSSRLP